MNLGTIHGLIRHGLGQTPPADLSLWDMLNAAGHALMTAHSWTWRTAGPVDVTATSGTNDLTLPTDFGELIAAHATNSNGGVEIVSKDVLVKFMAQNATGPFASMVCFDAWTNTLPARPKGLVWPTPGTDGLPTLKIMYYRRWVEVTEADAQKPPAMPAEWHMALVLRARAEAKLLQNDEAASAEFQRYENELVRLRAIDGSRQMNQGRMTGGADRFRAPQDVGPNWRATF